MERKDFIHSSTRIRSLESKLLTKEQFDRMIESNSLEDAIKVLQETSYSDVFNKIDRPEDYDKAIYNELTNLYETVMDLSNNRDVVDIVSLKYDAHNMKVILKDHVMGTDNTNLIYPMGRIKVSNVAEQAEKGDRKGIDKMLDGLATEAVYDYGDTLNPQSVDLAVDKRFYNNLLKISGKTDLDTLRKYAKDFIDFSNLIALFRMQRQNRNPEYAEKVISVSGNIDRKEILRLFNEPISVIVDKFKRTNIGKRLYKGFIQYEETGSIASFEKEFDNHIMDIAKEVKFISYGPEVIFAYLIAREIEIKNIRVILVSKLNKLSPEFIRERLRETYV